MTDEQQPDEHQKESQLSPSGVTQPSIQPLAVSEQAGSNPASQQTQQGRDAAHPAFVQIVGGDDLEPFEEQTLAISRRTYWIAIFAFGAALAAAIFVGSQVKIMSYQTQIMASQTESASASSLMDGMNTKRQLDIAQQQATSAGIQAKAAQDSVKAIQRQMRVDQRPWIKLSANFATFAVKVGDTIKASTSFQETGKTAAMEIMAEWVIDLVDDGTTLKFPFKVPRAFYTTGVLYPSDPQVTQDVFWLTYDPKDKTKTIIRTFTVDDVKKLNDGAAFIIVYGRVRYVDGFHIHHWTHYCSWTFSKPGSYHASQCPAYNRVDKNY